MSDRPARRRRRVCNPEGGFREVDVWNCFVCDLDFDTQYEFNEHLSKESHLFSWCLQKFQKKRKSLIKERHGICVEMESDGNYNYHRFKGIIEVNLQPLHPCKFSVEVVNLMAGVGGGGGGGPDVQKKGRTGLGGSGKRGSVILHRVVSLLTGPIIKDPTEIALGKTTVELAQGDKYDMSIEVGGLDVSIYHYPILFILEVKSERKFFFIVRELVLNVTSGENMGPSSVPEESPFQGNEWGYVSGTYEALTPSGHVIRKIEDFLIPFELISFFASGMRYYEGMTTEAQQIWERFNYLIEEGVNQDNYADYFHVLLHLEEFEAQKHIEKFNMTNVTLMLAEDDSVELEVPGLEEKRPSLLEKDLVYIRYRYGPELHEVDPVQFEGRISRINLNTIWIECRNGLSKLVFPGSHFDVRFGLNRFPMMIKHRAVDGIFEQELFEYIFPDEKMAPKVDVSLLPQLRFFNKDVANNPEQKQAVVNILLSSSMPAPYIIFGPPGTGKTITMVEAIMQVFTVCEDSVILVCAPSNASCDLLAQMLLPCCGDKQLIRLHSISRDYDGIPSSLHCCSNIEGGGIVSFKEKLKEYRIICCTLISAGKLSVSWIPRYHVTHVFMDECGQAVEPEAVAAVAGFLGLKSASFGTKSDSHAQVNGLSDSGCSGMLVLAGDPLQLGPVCASSDASKFGLGLSLLERLMTKCSLYQRKKDSFDPLFITKLVRNFRSHPDILLLPNELFYDNELEAHSKSVKEDPLCKSTFPVHFHSVVGGDEREGVSPSYFNKQQVEVIMRYVKGLIENKGAAKVQQKEIGILTPYTRQVYKLKQALAKKGWCNIEVGSTEVYQGREKRVMIISTVRSAKSALEVEAMYRMGFLVDPKRFNVAVTRAQSRLIVVGDPYVLSHNANWMAVIKLAQEHSTYVGAPFIPRDDAFVSSLYPLFDKMLR